MHGYDLHEELGKDIDNSKQIAGRVVQNNDLIPSLLNEVSSVKARVKFKSIKTLRTVSEKKPQVLYPYLYFFEELLQSNNNIIKWNAIDIIANLASVDDKDRFSKILSRFYGFYNDGNLITAGHVVDSLAKIVLAKPNLEDHVTNELLRIEEIPLPTEECRNILKGKIIDAFRDYFSLIRDKDKIVAFAERELHNSRNATKKRAEKFLVKCSHL